MYSSYIQQLFVDEQTVFQEVKRSLRENKMPEISVFPETGKLLYLLVKMINPNRVLEISALGGYSGIWLASALNEDGTLTSLEINKRFANIAYQNIEKAGLHEKVIYKIGPAL